MTGFDSKRQVALEKLDDDNAQGYIAQFEEVLQKEYQRGYDAGKASQPEQEPVAFIESKADNECADAYADGWNACVHAHKDTTPPKRPWAGLTDDEIEYWIGCNTSKPALVRAISKALKEKNT